MPPLLLLLRKGRFILFLLIALILSYLSLLSETSSSTKEKFYLSKSHKKKIERIAHNIADDIAGRGIKVVIIKDFTDLKGRRGALEIAITKRFRDSLLKAGRKRFKIVKNGTNVLIKGTTLPYKEKERFDLKIEIISNNEVISSYSAIFK